MLLASLLAFALQPAAPAPPDRVDLLVQDVMRTTGMPGLSLVVLRDGRTVKAKAYGLASVELNVPVTLDTVFALASVTKVFTATLVFTLVQEGKLGLDDRIGDRLADLPQGWREVTVRQLLSHTSGLPDVVINPVTEQWLGKTREEALHNAGALPMAAAPGSAWSYNQTNYVLLGMLVEQLTGLSFEAALGQRILQPLGLDAVTFGDARDIVPARATWYSRIDWHGMEPRVARKVHPAWVTYPNWTHACAGLNATAPALATVVAAIADGKIVERKWLEPMWTAVALADGTVFRLGGTQGMGLGWLVDDQPSGKRVGGSGGSSVAFRYLPADRLTVVVLTNCQGVDPDTLADGVATALRAPLAGGR